MTFFNNHVHITVYFFKETVREEKRARNEIKLNCYLILSYESSSWNYLPHTLSSDCWVLEASQIHSVLLIQWWIMRNDMKQSDSFRAHNRLVKEINRYMNTVIEILSWGGYLETFARALGLRCVGWFSKCDFWILREISDRPMCSEKNSRIFSMWK